MNRVTFMTLARACPVALLCLLGLALPANPAPQPLPRSCAAGLPAVRPLAQIVNSRDDAFQCLGLAVAGDAITAVRFESHPSSEEAAAGRDVHIREFPIAQIESRRGAVLDGRPGHDAVILQGRFARPSTNAQLVIRYLYNGFTNEYRQCAVSIGQDAGEEWHLRNALQQDIARIRVRTWSLPLIGIAGIADLEGACA